MELIVSSHEYTKRSSLKGSYDAISRFALECYKLIVHR